MEAATANGARGGRGTPRGRGGPPGGRGFRGGVGNSPGGRGFGRGRGGPPGGRGFGGGPPGGRGFRGGPPGGRGFRGARGNSPGGRGFGRGRGGPPGGHGFGRGRGNSPGGRGFGRGRGGPPRGRGFGRGQGHHPEGVDLSKNALEYPQILTKPVKLYIMPSCLTPSLKITNVPVNNFATQFEELKRFLFNILKGPCTISSEAELVFFYQKNLRGLWEVIFAFNSDRGRPSAVKALSVIHGKVFQSHHLIAERFDTLLEDDSLVTENCVRVSNLSTETTEEMLWQLFESCGKLGMIYLNRLQEDSLEALVNFEKPDSVTEALKLDGAKLDNSSINVVHLDWNQSIRVHMPNELTENQLNVELKDFKPTFIRIISSKNKIAFVYFPTKKLYTKAVTTLNETGFLGNKDCVTPAVEHKVVTRLFGAAGLPVSPVKLVSSFQSFGAIKKHHHHPRVHGAFVIVFDSKQAADDAIKASPVLVDGVPCPVSDSAYNLPPVIKKKQMRENLENTKKELEEGDSEEEEDNDDEDDDDDDDDEQELLEEEEDDEAVDEEEEEDDNEEEEDDDDEGEDGDEDEDEEESEESMDASNGVEATHKQPPSQINLKRKGAPNNRGQKKKMPKIN